MKPSKLAALGLAAATAAALGAAGAAAPSKTRTFATDGSVVALSADGARVAVATAGLAHARDRIVLGTRLRAARRGGPRTRTAAAARPPAASA